MAVAEAQNSILNMVTVLLVLMAVLHQESKSQAGCEPSPSKHASADFRNAECFCASCIEPLDGVLNARVHCAGQPSIPAEKLAEAELAMAAALNDGNPALAATAASGLGHAGLRRPLQLPEGAALPSSQPKGGSTSETQAPADQEAASSGPVEMQTGALLLRVLGMPC